MCICICHVHIGCKHMMEIKTKNSPSNSQIKAGVNRRAPLQEGQTEVAPRRVTLWAPFARSMLQDTISLSYSHRILQRVLDFSLPQEHIPTAHPPKHALKSRDALPVNHTSHEAVGRRARVGTLFHATGWKASRQRKVRGDSKMTNMKLCIVKSKGLPRSYSRTQHRADHTAQDLYPKWLRSTSQQTQKRAHSRNKWMSCLAARMNSENEHDPTELEVWLELTQVLKVCLFPSHLAPRGTRTLPTGLDPPSADDAIQPEFTNQLISNENS